MDEWCRGSCDSCALAGLQPVDLIHYLKELSPDFRRWITQLRMERYSRGPGHFLYGDGRTAEFDHETLTIDEQRHLRMVVYLRRDAETHAKAGAAA